MEPAFSHSDYGINLSSDSVALPPTPVRLAIGIFSLLLLALDLYNLFRAETMYDALLFVGVLVVITGVVIFLIKKANRYIQFLVDAEKIRSIDRSTFARTAYFSHIHSLQLYHSNLRIKYSGGSKERFPLPSYSKEEYLKLKNYLEHAAEGHAFSFEIKKKWFY